MLDSQFRCVMCGEVFDKVWSDEEAAAECVQHFGHLEPAEIAVVCDECFQRIHPENHLREAEEAMAETIRQRQP